MAGADELRDQPAADRAGSPGKKNSKAHRLLLRIPIISVFE
jgi:hypothetical protein